MFGTVIIVLALAVPALFVAQAKLFRSYVADADAARPMLDAADRRGSTGTKPDDGPSPVRS